MKRKRLPTPLAPPAIRTEVTFYITTPGWEGAYEAVIEKYGLDGKVYIQGGTARAFSFITKTPMQTSEGLTIAVAHWGAP